ncbi:MAG TPA: hypothetical protein DCP95_11460, partial [Microbacterium ginsengisoli]|nr:hypothetical protein [Microbacterium ginsengisoli]
DAVTAPDAQSVASAAATAVEQGEGERVLWGAEVPGALVIAAAVLVISALRHRARAPRGSHPAPSSPPPEPPTPAISIAAADHGRTS